MIYLVSFFIKLNKFSDKLLFLFFLFRQNKKKKEIKYVIVQIKLKFLNLKYKNFL